MKFRIIAKQSFSSKVRGLFSASIPFENRISTGDWSAYFGHYQNQRWGEWDSNSCWCLSGINCVEDQLEWLWKNNKFSQEAKDFFTKNNYIDTDGDFSLSERFIEIIGQQKANGGTAPLFWQLAQKNGFIPRDMLTYSLEQASKFTTENAFISDYFDSTKVTQIMVDLGQQFLQYINIAYQQIGSLWTTPDNTTLQVALRQAPLQIGIPIPANVSLWNNVNVQYDGGKQPAHEIELYAIGTDGSYKIFDQYMPNLKILSKDYYIPFCHQGVINVALTPTQKKTFLDILSKAYAILIDMLKQLKK